MLDFRNISSEGRYEEPIALAYTEREGGAWIWLGNTGRRLNKRMFPATPTMLPVILRLVNPSALLTRKNELVTPEFDNITIKCYAVRFSDGTIWDYILGFTKDEIHNKDNQKQNERKDLCLCTKHLWS